MSAASPIGPYRGAATVSAPLRPPGVVAPRSLEESWIGDGVTLKLTGELTTPKTIGLHIAMAVVTFGPPIGFGIGLFFGAEPFAAPLPLAFGGFFGWLWHRSIRGHRAAVLLNEGRLDEAERAMGGKKFGMELTLGLVAQMRGDHEAAARMYRAAVAMVERRPVHMQPVHMQAYPREAIALTTLGRFGEASQRLRATPRGNGPYLDALGLIASAYLSFATGEPPSPDVVQGLERVFMPVRGAWGALALAAFFRDRAGDAAGCLALLEEERQRAHADRIASFMPNLARWADERRTRRR